MSKRKDRRFWLETIWGVIVGALVVSGVLLLAVYASDDLISALGGFLLIMTLIGWASGHLK